MKSKRKAGRIALYAVLIIYAFITLYPFLWMVAASFKPLREIVGGNMSLISENMTLDNYTTIFGHSSLFPSWFLNSFFVATVGTVINVFINSMAGYSLSCLNYPGRNKIHHALLLLMMIPGQVLLIPNYLLLKEFGMLDSYMALILPAAANIGNIFLMRQFFMNFPHDVAEAAEIDGLNRHFRLHGLLERLHGAHALHQDRHQVHPHPRPAELPVPERRHDVEPGHGCGLHLRGTYHHNLSHLQQVFPGRSPHGRREISLSGVGRMCGSATSLRPLFCPLGSITTAAVH